MQTERCYIDTLNAKHSSTFTDILNHVIQTLYYMLFVKFPITSYSCCFLIFGFNQHVAQCQEKQIKTNQIYRQMVVYI